MRRNSGYYFYLVIFIIIMAVIAVWWSKVEERIVANYIKESGLILLSENDLEEIKEEAYEEGYEEGYGDDEYGDKQSVTWATVYYTDDGECYHTNPSCLSIRGNANIHEASLEDLYRNGSNLRPCDICVAHSDD